MQLWSALTCPACGHAERLAMPTDACVFFHPCSACQVLLRPNAGDCCVFCSFGSVPCPPMQSGASDCCAPRAAESPLVLYTDGDGGASPSGDHWFVPHSQIDAAV